MRAESAKVVGAVLDVVRASCEVDPAFTTMFCDAKIDVVGPQV